MTFRLLLIVFFTLLIALLSKVYFSLSANKAQDSNYAQDLKTEKPETTIGFKTEAMSSPDNLDKNQCLDQSTVYNHIMALSEKANVIFKSLSGKNDHRYLSLSLLYYFYTENSENLRLIRMPYDNNTVSHIDYPASDYAMATLAEHNQLTLSLAQGDFSRIFSQIV